MTREHRQAEMEAFGAAVLAEDYGAVPEGWGLQQMCGAGFGAAALPEGWFKVKAGVYRKKAPSGEGGNYGNPNNPNTFTVKLSPKTKQRAKGWKVSEKGPGGSHTYSMPHRTATAAMDEVERRFYPPRNPKKSKAKGKKPWWRFGFGAEFGQGPFPGVDTALQEGVREYAQLWSKAALDVAQGKVTEQDIEDATPDAAHAVIDMQSAVNALWGAAGQLERTQRGRARGGRYRHRQLVSDVALLLSTFFEGATDAEGRPLSWEDIVGELPSTSIGPARFAFGAKGKLPKFIEVESDSGMMVRLAIPSILTAQEASSLAQEVVQTADAIRDLAFTWQSRGQGIPQIPSAFVLKSLSQQSSLVPSSVFTVGGTQVSQCIRRKTRMGYPQRQSIAMCLNMDRAARLGPRGGYRKV